MSIHFQIPTQSRYLPQSVLFTTTFNAITPGRYDFTNDPNSKGVVVMQLQEGSVYLIESMSVSGNITEAEYLSAQESFPDLFVKRSLSNENVYSTPVPLSNYFKGLETPAWVYTDKKDDNLILTLRGIFTQLPSMIGVLDMKIQVSLNVYAIESSVYNGAFRDKLADSMGQSLRR